MKLGHAVVMGGSMAGLAASRGLTEHFDRVTLIERDSLSDGSDFRKGVPQARHLHGLLKRGENVLGGLFPDLVPSLLAEGATVLDFGSDMAWFHFGGWKAPCKLGLNGMALSRPLLERSV